MRKKFLTVMCVAALATASLTACGGDSKESTVVGDDSTTSPDDETDVDAELTLDTKTKIDVDSIYGDVSKYIELGEYKGIEAKLVVSEVTQEDIDNEVSSILNEYAESKTVDRAIGADDYATLDITAKSDGEEIDDYSGTDVSVCIGQGEYGDEFDNALIGKVAGDTVKVTVTYDDEWDEAVANKTVDYDITVKSVEEYIEPELTDEFVKEKLEYDSKDAFLEAIKKEIGDYNNEQYVYDTKYDIINTIVKNSKISGYSDDMYKTAKQEVEDSYMAYASMFGASSVEEIYEMFEMSDEDVENEIIAQINSKLVIAAIAKAEKLELTDKEYTSYLETFTAENDYETVEEFENDYGKAYLADVFYTEKVMDFVYKNAKITETEETEDSEEVEE